MLALERIKSNKLIGLEALLRRLPEETIEYNFYKEMYILLNKGYEGEVHVDGLWKEMNIHSPYYLFHNYETVNEAGNSHQIDTLLLTPHFIWVLEVKNISGRIDIDEKKHQLIRTSSTGTTNCYKNPVDQIKRHSDLIKRRLQKLKIELPVDIAIVLANESTIIGNVPDNISIFHASGLQTELDNLYKIYSERKLTTYYVEKIKHELMSMYHRKSWQPKLHPSKLRKGVWCKNCGYKSLMIFEKGRFKCSVCNFECKNAIYEVLTDYRYLHSEWISNRELREYLHIESRFAANRLIAKLNCEFEGTYRNRKYKIPDFNNDALGRWFDKKGIENQ